MSGQLLVVPGSSPLQKHLHVRIRFTDADADAGADAGAGAGAGDDGRPGTGSGAGRELRFVDQRTFGGLLVVPGGEPVPPLIAHIARDPLDPDFDDDRFVDAVRRRRTGLKRALLDQTLVSGIGNIYADETLWRAGLHGERPTDRLTRPAVRRVLAHARDVLSEAVAAGGTSFDALYVSTEGVSGLFEHSLNAYGREGQPCARCGAPVRRESFMNRSSFSCPRCQPRPRTA
jgi:formamidopyrimidine-DNA glycosylase